jgi:hypothetical protein
VLQGTDDISDDAATTYSLSNTNVNATMGGTNNKVYTATGMTAATGKSTVTIQRSGVTIARRYRLHQGEDGSSATTGFDDTLNAMPNSTTLQLLGSFSILVANGATLSMERERRLVRGDRNLSRAGSPYRTRMSPTAGREVFSSRRQATSLQRQASRRSPASAASPSATAPVRQSVHGQALWPPRLGHRATPPEPLAS